MNVQELLNLRTRFEELTDGYKFESEEHPGSCINTLKWFMNCGHKSNSLRNGFDEAKDIAQTLITEYENGRTEEARAW